MNYVEAIIALIPLVWMLVSLGILKMATHKACLIAVILTAFFSLLTFNMPVKYLGQTVLESVVYAVLSICWIIIAALLVYNITLKTGALEIIKSMLTDISSDRRIQALIIGFAFGGFLEAVAGFGTAVAIPAGILIAMGFRPVKAAVICLVSNTVPVALGVLGVPVISLAEASGLGVDQLAFYICIQLLPFAILLPLLVVYIVTDSIAKVKGAIVPALLAGAVFAIGQTIVAMFVSVNLAATVGAICSLVILIVWCKISGKNKEPYRFENEAEETVKKEAIGTKEAIVAWCPYIFILVLIVIVQLLPFLNQSPFLIEMKIYFGEGGGTVKFNWLTSSGSLLFISAVIGGIIQKMKIRDIFVTFGETLNQVKISVLTTILVVMLAKMMTYSGMITVCASMIATISGRFFPFLSPLLGALGTFITGSDTSSNILFGGLQKQTATQLNMNEYWIVAGNGSGATAGKMISPQSISIAAAATNNAAKESDMMGVTIKYCLIYVVLMGICVFAGQLFI